MISGLAQYYEQFNKNQRQYCSILAIPPSYAPVQTPLSIDDSCIPQGGLIIERRSMSGQTIEIGSTISAEITLKLRSTNNPDINHFDWWGAKLIVSIGVEYNGVISYAPIGEFYIDSAEQRYDIWTLSGLDAFTKFDVDVTEAELAELEGKTLYWALTKACAVCGVQLSSHLSTSSGLTNNDFVLPEIKGRSVVTWRNILQWIGEISGDCAFIDENGKLDMRWYLWDNTIGKAEITPDKRYSSHDSYDIYLTGLEITDTNREKHTIGDVGYQLVIENNPFITPENYSSRTFNAVWTKINTINGRYVIFEATTFAFPYLLPMDAVRFTKWMSDGSSTTYSTFLTYNKYVFNGSSDLKCQGKSAPDMQYKRSSAFTKQQAAIWDGFQDELNDYINKREEALRELSQLMANSIGLNLYRDDNGVYYFYDAVKTDSETGSGVRDIQNANVIYTFRSGGFAWAQSDDTASAWQKAQNNDWQYGITKEGNAYLKQINATGITVAKDGENFSTELTPNSWKLLYGARELIKAIGRESEGILILDKLEMTDNGYLRMGKARLYGTGVGMDIVIEE